MLGARVVVFVHVVGIVDAVAFIVVVVVFVVVDVAIVTYADADYVDVVVLTICRCLWQ